MFYLNCYLQLHCNNGSKWSFGIKCNVRCIIIWTMLCCRKYGAVWRVSQDVEDRPVNKGGQTGSSYTRTLTQSKKVSVVLLWWSSSTRASLPNSALWSWCELNWGREQSKVQVQHICWNFCCDRLSLHLKKNPYSTCHVFGHWMSL